MVDTNELFILLTTDTFIFKPENFNLLHLIEVQ